jgi:RNA-directed DNA polymerase
MTIITRRLPNIWLNVYTEKHFYYLINFKKSEFSEILKDKPSHYKKEKKIKKDGISFRDIYKPKRRLKLVLKSIHKKYLSVFTLAPFVHCGPRHRSISTAVNGHSKYTTHLSLDIECFFDRITKAVVRDCLLKRGAKKPVVNLITNMCCEDDRLPQGFPTSPLLSALVISYALKDFYSNFNYTIIIISVYADDILLSSDDIKIIDEAENYIKTQLATVGLVLNDAKREQGRRGDGFSWLSLNLHPWISYPRKKLLKLQQEAYRYKVNKVIPTDYIPKRIKKIGLIEQWKEAVVGKVVFIKSINSNKLLSKIEKDINN